MLIGRYPFAFKNKRSSTSLNSILRFVSISLNWLCYALIQSKFGLESTSHETSAMPKNHPTDKIQGIYEYIWFT